MSQNSHEGYARLDMIVRLLAIENEYGLNDFGWNLYRKMQAARVGNNSDLSIDDRVNLFKHLIVSWRGAGYDNLSQIELDKKLDLNDGSHRLAMSVYHNLDKINCKVVNIVENNYYGINWFIENDFTIDEINKILLKANEVCQKEIVRISCLLWPPVKDYFDEIEEKLSLVYSIVSSKDIGFSNDTFSRFVQAVYQIDDIEQWKIDKKNEYMSAVPDKKVRIIILEFSKPRFRYKDMNKNTILIQGEELKKMIRNCYKNKVENYFYDIICHTGDNAEQSEYIEKICYPNFSMKDYFDVISNFKWMIIKWC